MKRNLILIFGLLAILACPLASTAQQIPAALPNNQYLRGVDLTNSLARNMIGINRSNVVRIDPDAIGTTFGGTVTIDGALLAVGTTPATTGAIRLANASAIYGRNAADSANLQLISSTTGNDVVVGESTVEGDLFLRSAGAGDIGFEPQGTGVVYTTTALRVNTNTGTPQEELHVAGQGYFITSSGGSYIQFADSQGSGKNYRFGTGFNSAGRFDIQNTSDLSVASLSITGSAVSVNIGSADVDFVIASDTNANHFVSDAGLHTGTGAFGMGAAAVSGRFLNISPGAGSTVGVVILSAGLAVNTAAVTSGTALTVTGTVVMTSLTSASTGDYVCFNTLTNELTQGTATCSLSSQRYKSDIQDMDDMGLDTILKMRPVTFISRIHPEQGRQPGFIAEDAELVDRRLVLYDKGQANSFRYLEYTAVLTKALQQQQVRITELEQRLVQLEARH